MALSNMLKRSASRFAPLIFSHRHLSHNHHHTSALLAAGNGALGMSRNPLQRSFPSFIHRYSTRPSSDEALLRVIQSEIKCAEESREEEQAEEVPQGFPFKIEDHQGQQTITLTREYQGETVAVEVHMPDIITGAEDGAGDDDEEGEESANEQPSIPLVIQVSKTSGPILEFNCTAYPDEIEINSLSVKDLDAAENQIPYEGPDFSDLDENLQKAFHKYLEIRGIKPSTTNFLHGYMVDKDSKEYITWLKNLERFIKD